MAYDEELAQRLRQALHARVGDAADIREQPMFGGLTFMVAGHMACGVAKQGLMVRVGPDRYQDALARDGAREMDFTGRPLVGMVFVDPQRLDDEKLASWVELSYAFAANLPAKG
jgi:hypothetical protein